MVRKILIFIRGVDLADVPRQKYLTQKENARACSKSNNENDSEYKWFSQKLTKKDVM